MSYWKSGLGIILLLLFTASSAFAVEYEWKDTSGVTKSLADYKGKPVILHFWASWCPPCRTEMPELQAWSKVHDDVNLIVVSLDRDLDTAAAYLESTGIKFPALQGDMMAAQRLGIRGLPTTLVIGPDSQVRKARIGAVNWNDDAESKAIIEALASEG